MDWILPKGIVRNSSTVNQGLESIDQQPVDPADIAQFWKGISVMSWLLEGDISNLYQSILQQSGDYSIPQPSVWRITGGAYGEVGVGS